MAGRLDPLIHQPTRLRIMAALTALGPEEQMEFQFLRDLVGATDGALSVHLRKLEEAGYVQIEKGYAGRRPRTWVRVTPAGRAAFQAHVAALEAILHPEREGDEA